MKFLIFCSHAQLKTMEFGFSTIWPRILLFVMLVGSSSTESLDSSNKSSHMDCVNLVSITDLTMSVHWRKLSEPWTGSSAKVKLSIGHALIGNRNLRQIVRPMVEQPQYNVFTRDKS